MTLKIYIAVGLALAVSFWAVPAAANHNQYLCGTLDTDGNGWDDTHACLTQEDTGGDPECHGEGTSQSGYTGGYAYHDEALASLSMTVGGYERCSNGEHHHSDEEAVRSSGHACEKSTNTCQRVHVTWSAHDASWGTGCGTSLGTYGSLSQVSISMGEATGDGCPAGGPPNPGWGNVYPYRC